MSETIIVAIISLIGTFLGGLLGVLASQRLTEYRLKQLESKQDKHNEVIERTYQLESRTNALENKVTDLHNEIGDIKQKIS